jgi:hypothetical protein
MQIIRLSENTDSNIGILSQVSLALNDIKGNNNYGSMFMLKDRIELVTTQPIQDYRIYNSKNDKTFLCVKCPQLSTAIKALSERFNKEQSYDFKPEKDVLYLKITNDQALAIPKNRKLNVALLVYGVFHQANTGLSFLQMEVTDFKDYPLVEFGAVQP